MWKLGSKVVHFFHLKKNLWCLNSVRIEDMLWIEDIVKSTPPRPFLIDFKVNIVIHLWILISLKEGKKLNHQAIFIGFDLHKHCGNTL
jgi:hypothetical protein